MLLHAATAASLRRHERPLINSRAKKTLQGTPLGAFGEPFGNLQNPTQTLSYNRMSNQPLHLLNIDVSSAEILHMSEGFFQAAREVSQTVGWDAMNERLGCDMLAKPHPPVTTPG